MSNEQNDKLMDQFLDTLDKTIVCPYCGAENQLDPPLLCCGEVHAEEAYIDENEEVILASELKEAFQSWLNERSK